MDTVAWVLNFDAEYELAQGAGYTPSAAMRARSEELRAHVRGLVSTEDLVIDESTSPGTARGLPGRAWCPTPRALSLLHRAGADVPAAPSFDVLRAANHRRFSTELGPTLPGALFTDDERAVVDAVSGPTPTGHWLLKRPLALAGRGRLRVARGALGEADLRWVRASLRSDGLQVEPFVERRGDVALHGMLTVSGDVRLGAPTRLVVDERGAWRGSERAGRGSLGDADEERLETTARRVAQALHHLGYFGPFNLDAFHYADERGRTAFHPLCEINARYSMGFAIGFGGPA